MAQNIVSFTTCVYAYIFMIKTKIPRAERCDVKWGDHCFYKKLAILCLYDYGLDRYTILHIFSDRGSIWSTLCIIFRTLDTREYLSLECRERWVNVCWFQFSNGKPKFKFEVFKFPSLSHQYVNVSKINLHKSTKI